MGLQVAKGGGVEWGVCVLSSLFRRDQNKVQVPGVSSHEGYQGELFSSAELAEWLGGEVAAWWSGSMVTGVSKDLSYPPKQVSLPAYGSQMSDITPSIPRLPICPASLMCSLFPNPSPRSPEPLMHMGIMRPSETDFTLWHTQGRLTR